MRLEFTGTRADLLFKANAKGKFSVLIDGKRPSAIPELYGFTRVSAFPMSDWPLLLKVATASPLVAEDWSLRIDQASADGKVCHFSLRGSVTGGDGDGWSTNRFVSRLGRVVIEPDDWNLAYSVAFLSAHCRKIPPPPGKSFFEEQTWLLLSPLRLVWRLASRSGKVCHPVNTSSNCVASVSPLHKYGGPRGI